MRETLYIRLRVAKPDAPTAFCIAGADAALSWAVNEAPLSQVLDQAGTRRLVLLVPAAEVRLTQIQVPARAPAKVLQAAPYALEEQLAEDVDDLHFALGARNAEGTWPVAVVARTLMDEWLAPLRERGLVPDLMIPDLLCLPEPDATRWTALAEDEQISVRSGPHAGFTCAPADLALYLQAAGIAPETLLRIVVPRSFHGDFTTLAQPAELLPGFGSALEALLQNFKSERAINLLQGTYSQREDLRRLWQPWRSVAVLAAVWIGIAGLHHGVQAYRLGKELAVQDERNVQRFQQLFPNERRIVDLSVQAEQQMRLLKGGGAQGGFLPLLETLTGALSAAPGLKLQSLQLREGALFVGLGGSDLQQLELLRGWFAQGRNARMEVQSANSGADGVQIRLKLTPA